MTEFADIAVRAASYAAQNVSFEAGCDAVDPVHAAREAGSPVRRERHGGQ